MTTVDTERKPMTLSEWLTAAGMLLAVYVLVGLYWADSHASQMEVFGVEKPISYGLHVAMWPILIFTDLDLFGLHLS
jgi:ACR3 family arsenite efflux pump ArsB